MDRMEEIKLLQRSTRRVIDELVEGKLSPELGKVAVDGITAYMELMEMEDKLKRRAESLKKIGDQ